MNVYDILRTDFEDQLADCLQKWQAFNVTRGSSHFRNHDIVF